jgi:hypothetical protein
MLEAHMRNKSVTPCLFKVDDIMPPLNYPKPCKQPLVTVLEVVLPTWRGTVCGLLDSDMGKLAYGMPDQSVTAHHSSNLSTSITSLFLSMTGDNLVEVETSATQRTAHMPIKLLPHNS